MDHSENFEISDFALSTSLFGLSCGKAEQMINTIKELGFKKVELGFMHSSAFLHRFSALYKERDIEVQSLHNFCPYPITHKYPVSPDIYNLSSGDDREREKAISNTINTIDTAVKFGAAAVVLHLGYVPMRKSDKIISGLYKKSPENIYNLFARYILSRRRKMSDKYFGYTMRSLDKIVPYAKKNNIRLGIETRMYPHEVPDMRELGKILEKFDDPIVGYWHDTGHAEIKKNMKFEDSDRYFMEYRSKIVGVHLHDAKDICDHMPPGLGKVDFDAVLSGIPDDAIKVIEVHKPCKDSELREGSGYIQQKWLDLKKRGG
ncbi:MAG: sugar phosphate isomerase/epimerase [bacterium]|nr:sugar phosphate isomerase/epimerase [bacterium]